jgi:hypothetical protein
MIGRGDHTVPDLRVAESITPSEGVGQERVVELVADEGVVSGHCEHIAHPEATCSDGDEDDDEAEAPGGERADRRPGRLHAQLATGRGITGASRPVPEPVAADDPVPSSWYSSSTFTAQMSWPAPSMMFSTVSSAVNME